MVHLTCPHCGNHLRTPNQNGFRYGRCRRCKQWVRVPGVNRAKRFWRDLFLALLGGMLVLFVEYRSGIFNQPLAEDRHSQESVYLLKQILIELHLQRPTVD